MTSIEWLEEQFKIYLPSIHQKGFENAFQKAKEMHKQEIINAWIATVNELQRIAADKYYQETFVSKEGSTSSLPQQEISDEEIQKAIDAYFPKTDINARWGWKLGCEWYREQLKSKPTS